MATAFARTTILVLTLAGLAASLAAILPTR